MGRIFASEIRGEGERACFWESLFLGGALLGTSYS